MSIELSVTPRPFARCRTINPVQGYRPDGTIDDNDRTEVGPTPLAFAEWRQAGLEPPNLPKMRQFRLERLMQMLQERDYGGILLFDPLNIRYASDTTNMQIWTMHDPFRACFVAADGYMVIWDFAGLGNLLTAFNPLVQETRDGASFFYFLAGDLAEDRAGRFAAEIDTLMRERSGSNRRLAVDKIMLYGSRALERLGIEIMEGEEVTEKARVVKGPEEIRAMRCALHSCELALQQMQAACEPGMTEVDAWAILHAENIRRGGEWIETRLMSTGPRTNPWFRECGPRIIGNGDMLAIDTDLVGPYGMCADISRSWVVGDARPTDEQKRLFGIAHTHITTNAEMCGPGVAFRELTFGGHMLPDALIPQRYGVKMHGVGLCDEWPAIAYPEDWVPGAFDYVLEPGMAFTVEVYAGEVGGREGVKLEDQLLITENGFENLTRAPFDPRLLG